MVKKCKICGKLFKLSKMIHKVYPPDYDFNCCKECNEKAINAD